MYYLLFGCISLEMLAVIPTGEGGISLTATWVSAALFSLRVFYRSGFSAVAKILLQPAFFLVLTLSAIYGALSAIIMPRLFNGNILIFLVRLTQQVQYKVPLHPTNSNFTQVFYYFLSVALTVSSFIVCSDPDRRRKFFKAFIFGAAVAVLTGALDMVASGFGLTAMLKPFRNATYGLAAEDAVWGMRRVVGLTPEASTYAGLCVSFLTVLALAPSPSKYFSDSFLSRAALCLLLAVGVWVSTSSSGYLALAALGVILAGWIIVDVINGRRAGFLQIYIGLFAVTVLVGLAAFRSELTDFAAKLIDTLIVHKTSSTSYLERNSWNQNCYEAFINSFGLGVGLGSARGSGYIPSVLANLGLPGTACLVTFYAQMLLGRAQQPADRKLLLSLKFAGLAGMVLPILSGTSANFGISEAVIFGALIALIAPASTHALHAEGSTSRRDVFAGQTLGGATGDLETGRLS